ncbi:MAG: cupin domain-containing protein [Lachnospiraceae bacterium]|nr:cupin domain-containing protein [Lachnospiraceae bacterium]
MQIILLSGTSGNQLWPLTNDLRSSQFIKILKTENDTYESIFQRTCRQIRKADADAQITVASTKTQASVIQNQMGTKVNICLEPERKSMFSVIALAAAYLRDLQQVPDTEVVAVCPVDVYAGDEYFAAIRQMADIVENGRAKLALLGVVPADANEKYGYIIPETRERISRVRSFEEKPKAAKAEAYLKNGALWNSGVFAFRLGYVLDKAREWIGFTDYEDLYDRYAGLSSVSFDRAVAEKEPDMRVIRYEGLWKDISTWQALSAEMTETSIGHAICDSSCEAVHVINELNVPILCMGLKNLVISASAEGILVSDSGKSTEIAPFVEQMEQRVMFAEKSWGEFRVLDVGDSSMTVKATLNPGYRMNYHSHDYRDEVWTVISGTGRTVVDGMEELVGPGDVITMEAGCKHMVIADTKLELIEVQLGKEIDVHDKHKYEPEG